MSRLNLDLEPTRRSARSALYGANDPLSLLNALEWFVRLRWAFIGASLLVLALERITLPEFNRPIAIPVSIAALTIANIGWLFVARRCAHAAAGGLDKKQLTRRLQLFANGQIGLDLFLLTALVRSTGGIESPLAIFYVFHMALGPLLLPERQALGQCFWAMILYAAVGLGELFGVLAPHYSLLPALDNRELYLRPMYVTVALGAVSCCLIGTIYLTATIAGRLRAYEESVCQANAALQQSQVAIRDLQGRRSRFMQTAAHRLKSPLATVQTLATLIRDGTVPDARPTCERITRCCTEGITHVTELLTLARVQDADPQHYRDSRIDVGAVVSAICARRRTEADAKKIDIRCEVPESINLQVRVDSRDLADCIDNVIDNAIKFTQAPGAVSVRADLDELATGEGWIVVHVDDTGMGFDPDSLAIANSGGASVFDAYRRGNNALAAGIPGSGLGLAIVREVIEQAGGRIEVQSVQGSGTQFTLRFPACVDGEAASIIRNTRTTHAHTGHSRAATDQTHRPVHESKEAQHALC